MSKASIREHARLRRRHHRARRVLFRSARGRRLVEAVKASHAADLDFIATGAHIKTLDVDQVVDENIAERHGDYSPAADGGKKMCGDLDICGNNMNAFLIETAAKLKKRDWDFTYDDQFIADAQGQSVVDFKVAVYGNTQ